MSEISKKTREILAWLIVPSALAIVFVMISIVTMVVREELSQQKLLNNISVGMEASCLFENKNLTVKCIEKKEKDELCKVIKKCVDTDGEKTANFDIKDIEKVYCVYIGAMTVVYICVDKNNVVACKVTENVHYSEGEFK